MRFVALCLALLLSACAAAHFPPVGADDPASAFYAEFCALSQIKKIPGFGADIRGDIGGHSIFYLQGACLDREAHYPVLVLCEQGGAGLSVNEHFQNTKWVATPGHDLFFDGNLPPSAPLTQAAYRTVERQARAAGVYDGVAFHERYFANKPADWSREDWQYEISIGTDYAVGLARGRYCARVPVDRAAMRRMIAFLNAENAPYRAGATFRWNIFTDNCIHLAHNALAAAGLWAPWRTHRSLLVSIFDFPVPRNEFVNFMRRTNDEIPPDPDSIDPVARAALLDSGLLPARPGALAISRPVHAPNDVYETDDLKLIFYDDPLFGSYYGWFDAIFAQPRYTDAHANRAYFAAVGRAALARRKPSPAGLSDADRQVYDDYYRLMARWANSDRQSLAALIHPW